MVEKQSSTRRSNHGLGRIEGVAEGYGEPVAVRGDVGGSGGGAGAQRQAEEGGASGGDAVGGVAAGFAQASDQRGDEHADGDGGRVHADHSAGEPVGEAPASGGGVPVCAGGAWVRPAPGL